MTVCVRFAPSPTGLMHVGNARVALINWLFARKSGGRFWLRFDDTDAERSRAEFAAAIEEDMRWLGLVADETVHQSKRLDLYRAAFDRLRGESRIYPCYETPEELELKRKRQLARGLPPVYDRAALKLTDAERQSLEAEGRKAHWRFKLEPEAAAWRDLVHGDMHFEPASLSDPVLVRSDGTPLYTFTSVVDDIALAITHIIRGDDHISNSAVQIQLFRALGGAVPVFAHLPLLTDAQGAGLSKRLGSLSLGHLRAEGVEAMAVNSLLAKLGTSDAIEPRLTLAELVAEFDFAKFNRAGPKFDDHELARLNARLLHAMPFEQARARLAALGIGAADEAFWSAVRGNLARIDEAKGWWEVCRGRIAPAIVDAALTAKAAELLPAEPWNGATFRDWAKAVGAATGAKGKALYMPLRLALTGREHGPELQDLLPMIGRERAFARLMGNAA
jgi:glutamyl-tRNA synthetase